MTRKFARSGFTMIELLVVIGIIVLLLAILLPVVAQVRTKAFVAQTEAEMQRIMGGIQAYYHDHNAYPGPLAETNLAGGATPAPNNFAGTVNTPVTSSENLVLGLLGFLAVHPSPPGAPPVFMGVPQPSQQGQQAWTPGDVSNLNANHPLTFHYIDYVPEELSQSGYAFGASGLSRSTDTDGTTDTPIQNGEPINDSIVPEFLDHIPDAMPILYLRARVGAPTPATGGTIYVSQDASTATGAQYNFANLAPYGFNHVSSVDFNPANQSGTLATTPLQLYFQNPAIASQPRGKDAFILISAGADRLYGTKDDIIVTP